MATDECFTATIPGGRPSGQLRCSFFAPAKNVGAQAQGRASVLIQNGDWCGILPQPPDNIAETAQSNQGVIHGTRSARDGRLCAC